MHIYDDSIWHTYTQTDNTYIILVTSIRYMQTLNTDNKVILHIARILYDV